MEESPIRLSKEKLCPVCEELDQKPIRLIDVLATISSKKGNICFKEAPGGWDFHVISHTWSQGIRDLSKQIGKHITAHASSQGAGADGYNDAFKEADFSHDSCYQLLREADGYNDAFKEADFSHDSCYQQLREFLQLLAADAVKQIWFDALCINQTNGKEKSREIRNMGAYYSRSEGCYVLPHGVGEGYQLWSKEGTRGAKLPRWFTRVWTFQEFLLPSRLSFIVEGLDQRFIALVNGKLTSKAKKSFCRCFCKLPQDEYEELPRSLSDQQWALGFELRDENPIEEAEKRRPRYIPQFSSTSKIQSSNRQNTSVELQIPRPRRFPQNTSVQPANQASKQEVKPVIIIDPDQNLEILSSDVACAQCHSLPMIRKAHIAAANSSSSSTYLVDREVYLGLMQSDSYMIEPQPEGNTKAVQELRSLYSSLLRKRFRHLRPCDVIPEVGKREYTIEEDCVLGIVGLLNLGSGQLSQLRSGQGLEAQLVKLAKVCSPQILIELCGMDVKGCCTVGMSWAPDFHDSSCHDAWFTYVLYRLRKEQQQLEIEVKRQQVTIAGSLKLLAKFVSGHVLPVSALSATVKETKFMKEIMFSQPPTHFIVINPLLQADSKSSKLDVPVASSSCSFIPLKLITTTNITGVLILKFEFIFDSHAGSFEVPINTDGNVATTSNNVSFQVGMVLLGSTNNTMSGHLLQVIMLCLRKAAADREEEEELHKIGMLYLTESKVSDVEMMLNLEKRSMRECTIGGFGADLSTHVHIGQRTEAYTLNCSHSI